MLCFKVNPPTTHDSPRFSLGPSASRCFSNFLAFSIDICKFELLTERQPCAGVVPCFVLVASPQKAPRSSLLHVPTLRSCHRLILHLERNMCMTRAEEVVCGKHVPCSGKARVLEHIPVLVDSGHTVPDLPRLRRHPGTRRRRGAAGRGRDLTLMRMLYLFCWSPRCMYVVSRQSVVLASFFRSSHTTLMPKKHFHMVSRRLGLIHRTT